MAGSDRQSGRKRVAAEASVPAKAMVVALGRIGDLVLVTPILRALGGLEPRPEVHVLAGRKNHQVLASHPGIHRLYVYPEGALAKLQLMLQLRRERYDLWIDPKDHHSQTGRLLVRVAGPARSVGYNGNRRGTDTRSGCFTHGIPGHLENGQLHATERALAALEAVGLPAVDRQPWLVPPVEAAQRFTQFRLQNHLTRYAVVNISASKLHRQWDTGHWIELLRSPCLRDLPVVICALPSDRDAAAQLVASRDRTFYYPTQTATDLLAVVHDAMLMLTVDTAMVHIASAFNTPILALYSNIPSQYRKYQPLSRHQRAVMAPGRNAPVSDIPLTMVEQALCSLLEEIAAESRLRQQSA